MIDLDVDAIEAACDSLIADGVEYLAPAGMNDSIKVKSLITRLRQAEKYAARYREIAMDAHGIFVASGDQEAADAVCKAVIDAHNN